VVEVAAEESPTTESDSDEEPTEEKQAAQE
jgi:hypothetical protein